MNKSKKSRIKLPAFTGKDICAITCFFVSGFTGLVYEICWIRKASLVFGATILAISTVVAVFFAGLALGSYLFGKYSAKTSQPLKCYALLEVGLGVIALFNPAMFSVFDNLFGLLYPSIMHSFLYLSLIRCLFITVLLLPPTILIGGTLPLFCRQYVINEQKITLSVGLLYGLNTLGAAIGSMACGIFLIPYIGVNRTIWCCGIVNILIGLAISRMRLSAPVLQQKVDTPRVRDSLFSKQRSVPDLQHSAYNSSLIAVLFFLSGFVALGNEIIWTRYLSLIIHNTVYTYTLTLTVTLTGIVLGTVLISTFSDRTRLRALIFGMAHILIGISVLTILMLPAGFWKDVIDTQLISTLLWITALILLLPSILAGISFPLAIRMVVNQPRLAGIGVGKMTAINMVGGIVGSLGIGFLVIPWLGMHKSVILSTGISLFIGFTAIILLERAVKVVIRSAIVALTLAIWIAIPLVSGTKLPADFLAEKDNLIDFREGLNSNLAVVKRHDINVLEIDRLWQGEELKSNQVMAAHVPMLLHQNPKDVLVIGVGVGQTASRFLFYDIKKLDCVDIENELFEIIRKYFDASWMEDNRVRLIAEDGRNYLTHINRKYDVISIEIGQMFRPNLASFYTVDFYRAARERLNADGIVCQFVPLVFLDKEEFLSVIRTFLEVFPRSVLWYNRYEFLLIGSLNGQPKLSAERLKILHSDNAVSRDLQYCYWGGYKNWLNNPEVFAAGFLLGPMNLKKITKDAFIYYDDPPVLEYFVAKKQKYYGKDIADMLDSLKKYIDPPDNIMDQKMDDSTYAKFTFIRDYNLRNIVAMECLRQYLEEQNTAMLQKGFQWNPYNSEINFNLGMTYAKKGYIQKAEKYFKQTIDLTPDHESAHNNLGLIYVKHGKYEEAVKHFSTALEIMPGYQNARENLELALQKMIKDEIEQ